MRTVAAAMTMAPVMMMGGGEFLCLDWTGSGGNDDDDNNDDSVLQLRAMQSKPSAAQRHHLEAQGSTLPEYA